MLRVAHFAADCHTGVPPRPTESIEGNVHRFSRVLDRHLRVILLLQAYSKYEIFRFLDAHLHVTLF